MPLNPEKGQLDWFTIVQQRTNELVLNAVGGNSELAANVFLDWAKSHLAEKEHEEITRIQQEEPERFMLITTNMVLDDPENFSLELEAAKLAYQDHLNLHSEGK